MMPLVCPDSAWFGSSAVANSRTRIRIVPAAEPSASGNPTGRPLRVEVVGPDVDFDLL